MSEPILEIPAHIAALPEAEQGPALVAAIHDRRFQAGLDRARAEVLDVAREQHHLGLIAGVTAVRGALSAGLESLPGDSGLVPGILLAIDTIDLLEKEARNAQNPHHP